MMDPELLVAAYANGIFPMADVDGERVVQWYAPDPRAVLPLGSLHVPGSVAKLVRQSNFEVSADKSTRAVIRACAAPRHSDTKTWLSEELIEAYSALHDLGFVHSVECRMDGRLVGGLYGVAIRGAFFGESMYHTVSGASNVALVYLLHHITRRGYKLLDIQYLSPHFERFGGVEISRAHYEELLAEALNEPVSWSPFPA